MTGLVLLMAVYSVPIHMAPPPAAAKVSTTLLLVGEALPDGDERFWWGCEPERQTQPLSDELAPQLAHLGQRVVDGCDLAGMPIHKSYHRATLADHEAVNLGNALAVSRVVYGRAEFKRGPDLPKLGLVHVSLSVTLKSHDLRMDRALPSVVRRADGFAATEQAAQAKAVQLVVSGLLPELPKLTKTPKPKQQQALTIALLEPMTPIERGALLTALRELASIRRIELRQLSSTATVIRVTPPGARGELIEYLKQATVRFEVADESRP